MIKNLLRYESLIEGKVGHFLLEHDTSIPIAKEMALQFLKFICQCEDQAKAQQEAQEKAKKEEEQKKTQEIFNG